MSDDETDTELHKVMDILGINERRAHNYLEKFGRDKQRMIDAFLTKTIQVGGRILRV